MTIETKAQLVIPPQDGMEKPVNLPIPRVTLTTSSEFVTNKYFVLQIDGKTISLKKKGGYSTSDVISTIKNVTKVDEAQLITASIKDTLEEDSQKTIDAEKTDLKGRKTYVFREKAFINLLEALLPKMDIYGSVSKEPILLPDGQSLGKLTILKHMLMDLLIGTTAKRKKKPEVVNESDLAALYPGLPKEKAIDRACNSIYTMRMKLKQYGWTIINHTERPELIKGKKSEYELIPISNNQHKPARRIEERRRIFDALLATDVLPDALDREPPSKEAKDTRENAIASAKENLELECTDIILRYLSINKSLQELKENLFNFLTRNLKSRPPYVFSLRDIIKVSEGENSTKKMEEFFIIFLRKRLEDATIMPMPRQKETKSRLEKEIKDRYDKLILEKETEIKKKSSGEKERRKREAIIQLVCSRFDIKYEKPSKPATSSPAN